MEGGSSERLIELAGVVVERCRESGMTLGTAESCTGGMVSAALTEVAGASEVFPGGVVSYANEVKQEVLGVPEAVLIDHGAVSAECAVAMAEGARRVVGSDLALALTGIAGPGGGSAEKPVGLVYLAVADAKGVEVERCSFGGERRAVRQQAALYGLEMVLRRVVK